MSRKAEEAPAPENHERWIVSYADMVTLLWALFVVLYALSDSNPRKLLVVAQSIDRAFDPGVLGGSSGSSAIFVSGNGIIPGVQAIKTGDLITVNQKISELSAELGLDGRIQIRQDVDSITVSLSNDLLFATGKADLQPGSQVVLDEVAEILVALPNTIRVEGHTDDVPVNNPDFDDNWDLSAKRANNVLNYLASKGVPLERLYTAAYADTRPLADNDTPEGRALNRRADIVITYPTQAELDRALQGAGQSSTTPESGLHP